MIFFKKVKKYWFLPLIFAVWLLAIFIDARYNEKLREEYPVVKFEDKINARVLKIRKIKGGSYITKNNSEKIGLLSAQNYLYHREYLVFNIFSGDSISKNAFSDTIYIFSPSGEVKYFVHGEVINRHLR